MTDFAECSMAMQDFLMILLEICLIQELILLLIRITCFYGKKKIITAVTVFAVSFMLMGFLMNDHRYCQGESAYQLMLRMCPVSVLMAAMVVLLLYLCWAIWRERRRYHHSLSYWSVNEAVDDVPCGVCFSDPLGRIVLCNTKMHELSRIMTGSYLQDYEALRKVINGGSEAEGLRRLNSDSNVFYFPDDSVWMFQEYRLQEPDCAGYLQTVAVNVSEIYYNGEKIRANNEKLEILNHKLEEMYEKIGDKIREQETLAMKMQVHDNFGRSLLSIRRILERKENQDKMDDAFVIALGYLNKYPDLDGFYMSGNGSVGVKNAMTVASVTHPLKIISHDLVPETEALLKEGIIDFVISQNAREQGYQIVRQLFDYLVKNQIPGTYIYEIPIQVITREMI